MKKCSVCGKKGEVFKVHITKDIEEHWCADCIMDEEMFTGYRMKLDDEKAS